ncbi:MAG: polysaccharide deacetylase family protein [Henriciella sp.]|uniref:polysaccharide deacetylase family protein n=1 Tax=Henriciella sp. TaxID=1968823 RepID=UPI0032EE8466
MTALGYYLDKPARKIREAVPRFVARDTHMLPQGRYVSICFDDFPKSAVLQAKPELDKRGWKATWYAAGGMMASDHPVHGRMFDPEDLKLLRRDGHDIGCHTYSHMDCAPASDEAVLRDMERNRAFFRKHRLPRARSFAFPYGRLDVSSKRLLMKRMPALRGVRPGIQTGAADRGLLKATGIEDHNGGTRLALNQLSALNADRSWLILFTHDIATSPSAWGCTLEDFTTLLNAIERSGAEVVPVAGMLSRMERRAPN